MVQPDSPALRFLERAMNCRTLSCGEPHVFKTIRTHHPYNNPIRPLSQILLADPVSPCTEPPPMRPPELGAGTRLRVGRYPALSIRRQYPLSRPKRTATAIK